MRSKKWKLNKKASISEEVSFKFQTTLLPDTDNSGVSSESIRSDRSVSPSVIM